METPRSWRLSVGHMLTIRVHAEVCVSSASEWAPLSCGYKIAQEKQSCCVVFLLLLLLLSLPFLSSPGKELQPWPEVAVHVLEGANRLGIDLKSNQRIK